MIIANLALWASLAIYHLISNAHSWIIVNYDITAAIVIMVPALHKSIYYSFKYLSVCDWLISHTSS